MILRPQRPRINPDAPPAPLAPQQRRDPLIDPMQPQMIDPLQSLSGPSIPMMIDPTTGQPSMSGVNIAAGLGRKTRRQSRIDPYSIASTRQYNGPGGQMSGESPMSEAPMGGRGWGGGGGY